MRNVLVVSYYFPPNTGAPAWRPFSWANNFHQEGIRTTIITRHWTGKENKWEDFIRPNTTPMKEVIEDSYRVIYLPSKRNKWCVFFSGNHLLARIFGKLFFFLISIIGKLNNEIDGSLAFKDFIKDHLKDNRYDVVIITVPPFNMLQMVDLFHAHECKVVVDVRDLWNNMMLAKDYSPTAKQKFWDFIYEFHIKRWLKRATRLIVITPPFKDVLAKSYSGPIDVIYNGYEEGLFAKVPAQYADKFVFSVIGSIYPEQDISIMIDGLNEFLKDKSPDKVQLRFIGLGVIPSVCAEIKNRINNDFIVIKERLPKEEAIRETKMATVLSYPGWLGIKGIISTKIFDYIASGNPILIGPGDEDVIDELVKKTNTGISVYNAKDFAANLNKLYDLWTKKLPLNPSRNEKEVEFYSRENQARLLAKIINQL